jgi:sugar phosphate isomerase/epimerase
MGAWLAPGFARADADSRPNLQFPSPPRERIAVASYPFREFIAAAGAKSVNSPHVELKDFAAHVMEKFGINKIEPWTGHFPSTEPRYLEEFRAAVEKVPAAVVNIAVDGDHSPYAAESAEREKAVAFSRRWIDVAATLGSPSVRTNIPPAGDSKPSLERVAESLRRVVEYAASKNIVVSLENDNPESEDPFFLVEIIERVNSPWLHTLPDFANTLASGDVDHAYRGIDAMFGHAYCICHVKAAEANRKGELVHVDLARAFGFMKQHAYKGYCSMEWDSPGDPYRGTADLIEKTLRHLA